ncbi:MAG: FadR/GntR family transcriptional regulator [Acidimicrobiia bacterium]|nr:FadR/GntR family transcriptional regulator [Acidimicrobiia bacterium]
MTDDVTFEPISRTTVSSQIREQLLDRITRGEFAPGARVPSERQLTEQFGVARTSVREAMHGLVSLGVVERRGNRVFVAERLPEIVLAGDDGRKEVVRQLFETRRALEPAIFSLAAERSTDEARQRISELAAAFLPELSLEEFRRLDREFHTTVAAACGNPFLVELYGKVLDRLFHSQEFHALLFQPRNQAEVRRIIAESADHHRTIAEAISSGDPAATYKGAVGHLDDVEDRMVQKLV